MTRTVPSTSSPRHLARFGLSVAAACILGAPLAVCAQTPPPISGVTGTLSTDGSIDDVDVAAQTVVVKSVDGVKHVFHAAKDLLIHGGSGGNALKDLRPGLSVAVHYTVAGADATAQEIDHLGEGGLRTTEGVVTRVDRGRKEITIKLGDGTSETLQLTERVAAGGGKELDRSIATASHVIVFYTDESGRKVVHFFREAS